jgi:hypothetical protein
MAVSGRAQAVAELRFGAERNEIKQFTYIVKQPFPVTSTVDHQFTRGVLIAPARGAMVLPTRDEDLPSGGLHDPPNSDCTLLDINAKIPVFYALGCRKQSGANLWSSPQT